ncbi:hypothetical protein J7T55_004064 [Diaporthe amygdali]|uniref:uncharacterized protein n=1 Tax=Phomopsis amygdali TaxID=1214568 RepID=UPI0022FE5911|nr:uncharacterized protein J7T55_004064 [Diaporthe amygdali]KAJ0115895.1 hypothetical protein J7T55_004064 [Diaporthe amygdali]
MTLLAVLLLALFECLALRGQSSRTAWLAHNCGARELDRLATRQVRVAGVLRAEPAQLQTGDQTEQGETAAEHRVNKLLDHIIKLRLLTQSSDDVKDVLEVARRTRELDVGIASRSAWPLPRPDPGLNTRVLQGRGSRCASYAFFNHKLQSQTFDTDDPELINEAIAIRNMGRKNNEDIAAEIIAMVPDLLSAAREGSNLAAAPSMSHVLKQGFPKLRHEALAQERKDIRQALIQMDTIVSFSRECGWQNFEAKTK